MIHILLEGVTLCGVPGWLLRDKDGARWVRREDASQATCEDCCAVEAVIRAAAKQRR